MINTHKKRFLKHIDDINKTQKVLLALVFGSHNYGTANEDSDLDMYIFTEPTFADIYAGNGGVKTTNIKVDGDDIRLSSITKLPKLLVKCNQTSLEMLSSVFVYTDDSFKDTWEWIKNNEEEIYTIDNELLLRSMWGMANHKLAKLARVTPLKHTNEGKKRQDMYGYDTKELLHSVRLSKMINYIFRDGGSFKDAVNLDNITDKDSELFGLKDELINIKKNIPYRTQQEAYDYGMSMLPDKPKKVNYRNYPIYPIVVTLEDKIYKLIEKSITGGINE